MSAMLSLMEFPFEADEVARILQISRPKVLQLLLAGRLKSSHNVRPMLPTKAKFVIGWDMLEYMLEAQLLQVIPARSTVLAAVLIEELSYEFDDDCSKIRHLADAEIWSVVDYVASSFASCTDPQDGDFRRIRQILFNVLLQSWKKLTVGFAWLDRSAKEQQRSKNGVLIRAHAV